MAVELTKISSADYVQKTVATADGSIPASMQQQGLTAYYTAEGNPPGQWIGSGIGGIGRSRGDRITSQEAVAVWQEFTHPDTGAQLGMKRAQSTRRASDNNQLAETTKQTRANVSGFDLTFTIPKDVSILWALGDGEIKEAIKAAHDTALAQTITYFEQNIARTRGGHGGVASLRVKGLIAGQWDHWDSRDGDPHLHSHLVISNKVQREYDGKWVTLDSRSIHNHAVHLSEVHQNLIMDELTRRLGMRWQQRTSSDTNAVIPEVEGFPPELRELFSSRDRTITHLMQERIEQFKATYGRDPHEGEYREMKDAAWRDTRKPKPRIIAPLHDKCVNWRAQAEKAGFDINEVLEHTLGKDDRAGLSETTSTSVHTVLATLTAQVLAARQLSEDATDTQKIAALARTVEEDLVRKQATWTRANIHAEVERMTRLVRAVSPEVREHTTRLIVEGVLALCTEIDTQRYRLDTEDPRLTLHGRTIFDDASRGRYTSQRSLDREAALLAAATRSTRTPPPDEELDTLITKINDEHTTRRGFALAADQADAVRGILTDTTVLSVLIGPAGTGKTTTMAALSQSWETLHGHNTVIGLTTSAQAAHVLGEEIDTQATTIAKWLYETTTGNARRAETIAELTSQLARIERHSPHSLSSRTRDMRAQIAALHAQIDTWTLKKDQLVIVDEASMTSTEHLHTLVSEAQRVGAKILAVGDHRQIDAVEAGGALALLAENTPAHELTSVWRFTNTWEADASLKLRSIDNDEDAQHVLDTYLEHDRLISGSDEAMMDAAFTATYDSLRNGRTAIIVAATNQSVDTLNQRFTHERRADGLVDATRTIALRHDADAGIGDIILARMNNRRIRDDNGDFLRNGTLMTITSINDDGTITATRNDSNATITLPASYARQHCELGYATTVYRCQGVTVDESRILLPTGESASRELLYVGMTRGRDLNMAYIAEENKEAADTTPPKGQLVATAETPPTWQERLTGMMRKSGAEQSATTTLANAHDDLNNLGRLRAEYEFLLTLEDTSHIDTILTRHHGIDPLTAHESPLYATLASAHRAATTVGPQAALAALQDPVSGIDTTDETATLRVLAARARAIADTNPHRFAPIPVHLSERADASVHQLASQIATRIRDRQHELHQQAQRQDWAAQLPTQLRDAIAEYRDLYSIRTKTPLGAQPPGRDMRQAAHWQHLNTQLEALESTARQQQRAPSPRTQSTEQPFSAATTSTVRGHGPR